MQTVNLTPTFFLRPSHYCATPLSTLFSMNIVFLGHDQAVENYTVVITYWYLHIPSWPDPKSRLLSLVSVSSLYISQMALHQFSLCYVSPWRDCAITSSVGKQLFSPTDPDTFRLFKESCICKNKQAKLMSPVCLYPYVE